MYPKNVDQDTDRSSPARQRRPTSFRKIWHVGQITGISSPSQKPDEPAPGTGRGLFHSNFLNRTAAAGAPSSHESASRQASQRACRPSLFCRHARTCRCAAWTRSTSHAASLAEIGFAPEMVAAERSSRIFDSRQITPIFVMPALYRASAVQCEEKPGWPASGKDPLRAFARPWRTLCSNKRQRHDRLSDIARAGGPDRDRGLGGVFV